MGLRYRVHPGNGPHLLLVHGFLTGPAQWRANLAELQKVATPVTVSLWGHAGAPSPEDPAAYEPAGYVAGFETIRAEIGAERWYLLGYSLGAGLTLRYAFEHRASERPLAGVGAAWCGACHTGATPPCSAAAPARIRCRIGATGHLGRTGARGVQRGAGRVPALVPHIGGWRPRAATAATVRP